MTHVLCVCRRARDNHILDEELKDVRSVIERSIGWLKTKSKFIAGPIYFATQKRLFGTLLVYSALLNRAIKINKNTLVKTS